MFGGVTLPQRASDPVARRRVVSAQQSRFTYQPAADNPLAPIAVAGKYPLTEQYLLDWAIPYLPQFLRSFVDTQGHKLAWKVRGLFGPIDKERAFTDMFSRAIDLPPPAQLGDWRSDGAFARRWVDGPNPLALERVRTLADLAARMPITDAQLQTVLPGATLANELAAGRLFLVDYALLEQSLVPPSPVGRDSRWRDKYLPAPVVLLVERAGVEPLCDLLPVAILIDQPSSSGPNPLYLRDGSARWRLARTYVDVADFNHQALSGHLARHHYLAEPFAVTTRRQLAPSHPLSLLLFPHTRYTIAVNHAAWGLLKKPGSIFDEIYAGELVETREIMKQAKARWPFGAQGFEADITARGVETGPAEYPWRDDGRLWEPALERYARDYVGLFYAGDADVVADWELQAWFTELGAPTGGDIAGLTPSGVLQTVDELVTLLAQFLFLVGPSHAAVHYPQTDYFTYPPMMPGAAYKPPPLPGETVDDARILATWPDLDRGADQFNNNQIAYYRFDRFGDYDAYPLGKLDAARAVVARLQADLSDVESAIAARNRTRRRPYLYMLPSLVPNSVNV